jgi:hypothetical protein
MRLLLALLLVAGPLAAQDVRERLEGRIPSAAVPAVDSLVQVAAGEGLPTEPLVQKALEGGAKRVTTPGIVAAVATSVAQLREARDLLVAAGDAPPATPAEITTIAWALRRGLPKPVVQRIVAALPNAPRAAALHAVADLAAHHFPPDSAADLIIAAIQQGLQRERLLDVSAAAVHEVQRGHTRAEALAIVRHELPHVPAAPKPTPNTVARARRPPVAAPPTPPLPSNP